ncbi:MAG: hypothetical protein JSV34_05570 [Candidatus Omnitrophota bacterium]|nr:MAG: hypothetical protein JSV34_05570 [Candidatus Omnitrophota bacterium]
MIVLVVLSAFAVIALYFMVNEATVVEHKVRRMRGFYSAQAAIMYAQKRLEEGATAAMLNNTIYNINNLNVTLIVEAAGTGGCAASSGFCVDAEVDY